MTEKEEKRIYILSEENTYKAVLKLGLPLVAGMFIMMLYNLVDTYFIGLTRDDYQLAAVNLAYPVMMISIAIANMVGTGASSLISRSLGLNDKQTAEHTLTTGFVLTIINGVLVAAIGLLLLNPIVTVLGAKSNTFDYTRQYVAIILAGSIFTIGNYTFGQLLRSEGAARQSILGMVVGTVVNIILDPVFIFALKLYVAGAAIATILGNAAGMFLSLSFYIRKKTVLSPSRAFLKPTLPILKEIFWVGVPATLETLLTSVAYVINNNLSVAYGELTVAAMGISQKIMSFGSYLYQGFAAGMQPLMGYNYGAKNYKRMMDSLKSGLIILLSLELVVMAIFGLTAPVLIGVFTETAEVITIGSRVLRTTMCFLPFVGAVSMCRISFQSMGKPQYAFGITLVRQIVLYVPLLFILNHFFGFYGMIWSQTITDAIMMIASISLFLGFLKSKSSAT